MTYFECELSGGINGILDNFCGKKISSEKIDVIKRIVHFFPMKFSPINYIDVSLCKKISLVMKTKQNKQLQQKTKQNKKNKS